MRDYDAVYLAPHLDDVALSCGGQIFDRTAAGQRVLIVTVMAGDPPVGDPPAGGPDATALSPFAQELHDRWALPAGAAAERREEDAAACAILGADFAHWEFPDCIYRTNPLNGDYLYASESAIFGAVDPVENGLIAELADRLSNLPRGSALFAPLAIGHHVDHQLVRKAAVRQAGAALLYYEDYPYVRHEAAAERALSSPVNDWVATVIPVSAAALAARIDAVAAFTSQVGTFFDGRSDLESQIKHQVEQVGGERYWQRLSAPDRTVATGVR